ncbi:MAG TPA: ABC transporter ATP-binding protein [Candidatus Acidoferrales bacterium]|nr:ABC transporter ATP-binding protein [Candidatus Acidoferrales bacterium]
MEAPVIETHGLRRWFGAKRAVADLSLTVRAGEVFGFLGPNGAGKTTSLKMLLGLVVPSGGEGRVLGEPLGVRRARARIGFLPEHFRFHEWLTGRELMHVHGRLYGLDPAAIRTRTEALLARVDLTDAAGRRLGTYSKGMAQRLGLAAALLPAPRLVFLDEPTSGLDPLGRMLVRDVIHELRAAGVSVFLNSHLLGEVEATCDRVAFVKQGRVVHEHVLAAERDGIEVEVRAEALTEAALAAVGALGRGLRRDGPRVQLRVPSTETLPEIARVLVAHGARLHHLASAGQTLEQLFLRVMEGERPG